jgi:hypothetical protein
MEEKLTLGSKIDYHDRAQTTLAIGEGGLPHNQGQGGAPPWLIFHLAALQQPTKLAIRNFNHDVGVS